MLTFEPAVNTTVWSGAEFVIVGVAPSAAAPTVIPVPATKDAT